MDALKIWWSTESLGYFLALSLWALAVGVERWLYYRRVAMNQFDNIQLMEMALTKRLVVIGTAAENAPYIGLLGTVLGIMLTFHTDEYIGNDGGRRNHGRVKLGAQGDCD